MPQTKILVDSNSYFRLAQNLHPLLSVSFGSRNYTLYAHEELTEEFKRTGRLQTKFDWFTEPRYAENRSKPLQLGLKERKAIDLTFSFMWQHVRDEQLGPSRVDVRILAAAAECNLMLVTDDQDLFAMGIMYGVHCLCSLELMRLMYDENHIKRSDVERVVEQWVFDHDKPANHSSDYRKYFGSW